MLSLHNLRKPGQAKPALVAPPTFADDRLREVVGDARLFQLFDGATWGEGPVWHPAMRRLLWSDIVGRRLLGWSEDGAVDVLIETTQYNNGNAVDAQGRVLHCEHGRRAISRTDASGRNELLVDRFEGRRLNSPNDIVIAADGAVWFTDPIFGIRSSQEGYPADPELDHKSVYRFEPDSGCLERKASLDEPNGIAFSPNGETLYVSETSRAYHPYGAHNLWAYSLDEKGDLGERHIVARVEPGIPDGFTVDGRGWIWTSSQSGIQVFTPEGERLGEIPTPAICTNVEFGGTDGKRLFAVGADFLWAIDLP